MKRIWFIILLALLSAAPAWAEMITGPTQGRMAFDSVNNRYLLVYLTTASGPNYAINGKILNANGTLYKSEFSIRVVADQTKACASPVVAFDYATRRYLVIWQDSRNANADIYAQLVSADGDLITTSGTVTTSNTPLVANDAFVQSQPEIASDSNGKFMVVWRDMVDPVDGDIHGRVVPANAGVGAVLAICDDVALQQRPSVAYDSSAGKYLVAWVDYRDSNYNIYGRLIPGTGVLDLPDFFIVFAASDQTNPRVASVTGGATNFMVAYRNNDGLIYGRLVTSSTGAKPGDPFPISSYGSPSGDIISAVAYGSDRYLVTWSDSRNSGTSGNDIYGQYLNASGNLMDANFAVNTNIGNQLAPFVAGNTNDGSFLAIWTTYDANNDYEIKTSLLNAPTTPDDHGSSGGGGGCFIASAGSSWQMLAWALSGLLAAVGIRRR